MSKLTLVVLAASLASSAPALVPGHLPILNHDLARARLEAGRRHVPVFVEVWAPW